LRRDPPMLYAPLSGLQDYKGNVHLSHWSIKLLKNTRVHKGKSHVLKAKVGTRENFP
jgi:hypothetical protein